MLNLKSNKDTKDTMENNIKDNHYNQSAIEPFEFMALSFTREEFIGFLKGNILKYSLRAPYKNQEEEDRRKCNVYKGLLKKLLAYPTVPMITCLEVFKQNQSSK